MSKTKRLLSVTLAIAMIILSAFSAFAEDTETVVEPLSGTVAAGNVTVKPDVTEVTVPVTITFENKQTSPHGMFDISADGATLKSATLVSFNNDNYVEDPNLSDEENIDKSVYLDADGINSANGRIVVESSTDESKKPATSEVKIDVVLEFATALKADQVIDVVIDGIQATNFSEASWDGMKAVNGTITVEAAEPEKTVADYIANVDITNSAENQSVTGTVSYTVETTQALFSYVKGLGGEITALGLRGTWDGSDPATSTTGAYAEYQIPAGYFDYFATNGWAMPNLLQVYYTGMNIYQMADTNVRFASNVTYKLNNETIIVYAEVTSQVLMDYLRIQTEDEKSKAIVDVYDLAIATESVDVNGSSSNLEADFGPTFVPSYNLHDIKINGTVSYSAAQIKSLFSYVKGLGGEITALGLRGTWDGSDPTTSTTGAYAEYQIPAGYFDYFATNGWAMPNLLQVYYTGMNVAQFNTDVKFAASYTYKDANGVSHVEYLGDVLTYSFNDLISGDTTDLAVAYKELYNTISGE